MKFAHADGTQAPSRKSLQDGRQIAVKDGVFEVDPCSDELRDRLEAKGHTPLEEDDPPDEPVEDDETADADDDDADVDDAGDGDEEDVKLPEAGAYTEQQIVEELDYREKQAIAGQYDHISGNAGEEKLTEELIKQSREEVED